MAREPTHAHATSTMRLANTTKALKHVREKGKTMRLPVTAT